MKDPVYELSDLDKVSCKRNITVNIKLAVKL